MLLKKRLIAITGMCLLAIIATSCKTRGLVENGRFGCWYEESKHRAVCGTSEGYNAKDTTYTMRVDGWSMKIKATEINW